MSVLYICEDVEMSVLYICEDVEMSVLINIYVSFAFVQKIPFEPMSPMQGNVLTFSIKYDILTGISIYHSHHI